MMDGGPGGLPQVRVVLEDTLQEAGLLPPVAAQLLLSQDPTEDGPEALGVREDGIKPGDESDGENLVRHHVAVDHHHLQSFYTCLKHCCEKYIIIMN